MRLRKTAYRILTESGNKEQTFENTILEANRKFQEYQLDAVRQKTEFESQLAATLSESEKNLQNVAYLAELQASIGALEGTVATGQQSYEGLKIELSNARGTYENEKAHIEKWSSTQMTELNAKISSLKENEKAHTAEISDLQQKWQASGRNEKTIQRAHSLEDLDHFSPNFTSGKGRCHRTIYKGVR